MTKAKEAKEKSKKEARQAMQAKEKAEKQTHPAFDTAGGKTRDSACSYEEKTEEKGAHSKDAAEVAREDRKVEGQRVQGRGVEKFRSGKLDRRTS